LKPLVIKYFQIKRKLTHWWIKLYYTRIYKMIFSIHPAISYDKGLMITGRILLKIDPFSTLEIGQNVRIHSGHKANPFFGERRTLINVNRKGFLSINEGVGLSNCSIYCTNRIIIGKNVFVGGGTHIYDSNFHAIDYDERKNGSANVIDSPIEIKEGAFIGGGSHICKGVTIGEKAIIASGSVVIGDVPDEEIWGGNPAKFIKKIK